MEMNNENGILKEAGTACEETRKKMEACASGQDEFVTPAASSIRMDESTIFISPVGRLDTVTSAELKDTIAAYDWSGRDAELDFTNVEYISSAGLRLLVSIQKQAKACGRTMVIRNINAVVREVFRISGFNKAFTVL